MHKEHCAMFQHWICFTLWTNFKRPYIDVSDSVDLKTEKEGQSKRGALIWNQSGIANRCILSLNIV